VEIYLRVSKVVEKKKKEKAPKVTGTCDQSKECENFEVKDQEVFDEMASWPAVVEKR